MRVLLSSTVAACAAVLVLSTATEASATSAAKAKPVKVRIVHKTSAIYQYDPSPVGGGPTYDTVIAYVQLRHCPAGNYLLDMSFVQDGVSYPYASSALGVGEFSCTATDSAPRLGVSFYGNGLHPGTATVTVSAHDEENGEPLFQEQSGTVRIPKGPNNPPDQPNS
jgi:hypothetical protein